MCDSECPELLVFDALPNDEGFALQIHDACDSLVLGRQRIELPVEDLLLAHVVVEQYLGDITPVRHGLLRLAVVRDDPWRLVPGVRHDGTTIGKPGTSRKNAT